MCICEEEERRGGEGGGGGGREAFKTSTHTSESGWKKIFRVSDTRKFWICSDTAHPRSDTHRDNWHAVPPPVFEKSNMAAASAARTDSTTKRAEFAHSCAHGCRIHLVRGTWLPPYHPYADLDRRETCSARVCHLADLQELSIIETLTVDPATRSADPRLTNHLACSELIERLTLLIVKSTRNRRRGGARTGRKISPRDWWYHFREAFSHGFP